MKRTRFWVGVLAAAALLSVGAILLLGRWSGGGHMARIYQDGVLIREIDLDSLSAPLTFTVEFQGRTNSRAGSGWSPRTARTRSVWTRDGSPTAPSPWSACPTGWSFKSREEGMVLTPPQDKRPSQARRLTRAALLTAIALTIFLAEAQLPPPVPIPGIKLGLANIVTVYAMFVLGPRDTLLILLSRIFLGAVFSGQMMTLLYSLGGGLLSYFALLLLRRVLGRGQLWVSSPLSAVCHNLGQLLAAAAIAKSWVVLVYLPYLVLAGLITGTLTGLCAQLVVGRLSRN